MRGILAVVVLMSLASGTAFPFDVGDIEIHGFASTGYMKSNHNNFLIPSEEGSFEFNEAGINFAASLTNDIRVGMQLYAYDIGDIGNNDIKLEWAFLDYQWKEELGIRLGKIKTPYGLYNEVQDYDMLRTSTLLPQSVYYKYHRDTIISFQGVGIYGNLSMGPAGTLGYDLFAGTMDIENDGGLAKTFSQDDIIFKSSKMDYVAGGRIKWRPPLDKLLLAGTLYQFDWSTNLESSVAPVKIRTSMPTAIVSILSAEYSMGNLTAAAEYYQLKGTMTVTQDMSALGMPNPDPTEVDSKSEGYYGRISYRLTDWLEAGAYYSVYYPDKDDRDGENQIAMGKPDYAAWQKDLTLSTRFDITDFWLVKLEVHFMDGVALCVEQDNPDGYEKDWTLFAVKTTFSF
ncbi:hypothetical protein [Desulfonema magnum]|uniref:Porin domain-containing protein n=1 Tax=Desulfonema magnum TaxID=45655 RepID=A0A975BTF0_9BACT|nr:hypothetical protein [Desulfonema magnum]QTA91098.1 porin domain-containing protein [Desulfonema magnum]